MYIYIYGFVDDMLEGPSKEGCLGGDRGEDRSKMDIVPNICRAT